MKLDCPIYSKQTNLKVYICSWNKIQSMQASPAASKNTGIVLVPCQAWKCVPTAISSGVDISEVPGCHLLRKMSSH